MPTSNLEPELCFFLFHFVSQHLYVLLGDHDLSQKAYHLFSLSSYRTLVFCCIRGSFLKGQNLQCLQLIIQLVLEIKQT